MCLALAMLPASGEQPDASPGTVALYIEFQQNPPATVLAAVQDEVTAIMEPMGLQFEWRSLARATGSEVSPRLAVVSFKGRCDNASAPPRDYVPGKLGWTYISNGVILPFTDVDCDGLRGFLGKQLLLYQGVDRDEALGRAAGRVLAHEFYHIFANTKRHGSDGVAKPMYSVQDLLRDDFRFEEHEMEALKKPPSPPLE
jgi:hypothetical protein